MSTRRRAVPAVLFTVFVLLPLLEIYVIVQVGQVIGAWWTILLLVADSLFGAWLLKHEGGRAWRNLRDSLQDGRVPSTEIADGGLILVGGTLMLAPGFITDVLGILLILPLTRPVFRGVLAGAVARRLLVDVTRPGAGPQGPVVRGEVVDD
ncbi:FxsA family protein [Nocardioides sp.]|uniref:FxsA family protein n=1 Tax=Nocardioides sp. TaxID=35761 RepID=UPI003783BB84